jgi:DNA polymerase-1
MPTKSKTKTNKSIPNSIGSVSSIGEIFGDLDGLEQAEVVALDTETTGLKWGSKVIGVSLAWTKPGTEPIQQQFNSCYIAFNQQRDLFGSQIEQDLLDVFRIIRHKTVPMHTQSFDYRHMFYSFGAAELPQRIVDVSTMSWMVGAQTSRSLATLYAKYVGDIPTWVLEQKEDRAGLYRLPPSTVAPYARWDAEATLALYYKFMRMYSAVPAYRSLYERDIAFTRLVNSMMVAGVPVNRQDIQDRLQSTERKQKAILAAMREQGVYLNPDSPDQVLAHIKNHGRPYATSTDAEFLGSIAGVVPFVEEIVAYRQLHKAIGSWYDSILYLSEADGRMHVELKPFGTRSYRMSADDINAQAIPMKPRNGKNGKARAFGYMLGIFAAEDPDEELWQFDKKQAEVRWAGMLSGDNALAEVFNVGIDPYKAMSQRTWNTETRRADAKQATLAAIYEIGVRSFSIKNGVEEKEARLILDAFRASFPDLRRASRSSEREVDKLGYIELFDGRRRYFAEDEEHYKGFNQKVQGAVSEHMQLLMLEAARLWPGRLRLQIHDSLVLQVPRDPVFKTKMKNTLEEIANELVPEKIRNNTTPRIPFLLDSESWQEEK